MSETKVDTETMNEVVPDVWPPVAHITRKPVREDGEALCGAKLMGMELPNASKVCPKCVEIFRAEEST